MDRGLRHLFIEVANAQLKDTTLWRKWLIVLLINMICYGRHDI